MDQGRQAGGALDAPVLSPLPRERGPLAAERARVQLGQPLATTGAATAHRELVVDQPAAAPRQDGWTPRKTRAVLLAAAGREPPDPPPVRVDASADLGVTDPDRLTGEGRRGPAGEQSEQHGKGVREMWAVVSSSAAIQVVTAWGVTCDPDDKNIRTGEVKQV